MKLNSIEKLLMNNPLRVVIQRYYEAPLLQRFGGRLEGLSVLEIGCGRGVGTQILVEQFGAARVFGFDLDPDMVRRARIRLVLYESGRVSLAVANARHIPVPDASFDAVVDFGIIHHVENWQAVIPEVRRVLKPGGRFLFEEVTRNALERWAYRAFLAHPKENRFSAEEFIVELERNDIRVGHNFVTRIFGDFVIGAGIRGGG